MKKDTYSVEVIGFSQTELMALASVFDLSSRRVPKFVRHNSPGDAPDILLVDANDIEAVRILGERNASGQTPTIMIGDSNRGTSWPLLARPIRWMKLFQAFDVAIGSPASEMPKPAAAAVARPVFVPPRSRVSRQALITRPCLPRNRRWRRARFQARGARKIPKPTRCWWSTTTLPCANS